MGRNEFTNIQCEKILTAQNQSLWCRILVASLCQVLKNLRRKHRHHWVLVLVAVDLTSASHWQSAEMLRLLWLPPALIPMPKIVAVVAVVGVTNRQSIHLQSCSLELCWHWSTAKRIKSIEISQLSNYPILENPSFIFRHVDWAKPFKSSLNLNLNPSSMPRSMPSWVFSNNLFSFTIISSTWYISWSEKEKSNAAKILGIFTPHAETPHPSDFGNHPPPLELVIDPFPLTAPIYRFCKFVNLAFSSTLNPFPHFDIPIPILSFSGENATDTQNSYRATSHKINKIKLIKGRKILTRFLLGCVEYL